MEKVFNRNSMNCKKCQERIPPLRIKALPSATTCVNCSTTEAVYVRAIITGKTTYSELEVIKDPEAAAEMRRWDNMGRTGFGSSLHRVAK